MQSKKTRIVAAILLGVGFVFFLAWFFFFKGKFSYKILNPFAKSDGQVIEDQKNVENPLNGELFTRAEAESWFNERPIGVMVNNFIDARPQSGVSEADIIYEIVAEGSITRYLMFFLSSLPEKVGPIRSTREYYLIPVKELGDAELMHIGWSPQAEIAIDTWPVRSFHRGGIDCSGEKTDAEDICYRDFSRDVAFEHTAYANAKQLRVSGAELGWTGERQITPWKFKSDTPHTELETLVDSIQIDFDYVGDYSGIFKYDNATNSYLRFTGFDDNDEPNPMLDFENGSQVKVKNVIVQFAAETAIVGDDKNRLNYELIGSGEALVFIDGKAIKATWSKASRDERTLYYDTNGNEVIFNRGKVWLSIVADYNMAKVTY